MKWENFTAGRVEAFKCATGKNQSIFWDGKTPGLGLRVTSAGAKSYIFETSLKGKTLRITIGDTRTWTIAKAQAAATELKAQTDQGIDPRQVRADKHDAEQDAREAKQAGAAAMQAQQTRESVTLGTVWTEYLADRAPQWGERHYFDHVWMIAPGGEARTRSKKLTEPGPLASLAVVRLVDLTPERVEIWAKLEGSARPTRARLALRQLKACLSWCAAHPAFGGVCNAAAAKSKRARESLGKPNVKHDVLQREQLAAWFAAVQKIKNPVINSFLQCLLLTGARREELAGLQWADVDFQWLSLTIRDKMEGQRTIPLCPYTAHLLAELKRWNDTPPTLRALRGLEAKGETWEASKWVFSSRGAASGRLAEPRLAHNAAVAVAGLPEMTLHGLRRSFASLSEWVECPAGIAAQIQGHAPQGVREQNYIRRSLDLLRMWHIKIEAWVLEQAQVKFTPAAPGLPMALTEK